MSIINKSILNIVMLIILSMLLMVDAICNAYS